MLGGHVNAEGSVEKIMSGYFDSRGRDIEGKAPSTMVLACMNTSE